MSRTEYKLKVAFFCFIMVFLMQKNTLCSDENREEIFGELSLKDLLEIELSSGSFLELDMMKSPVSMTIITSEMVKLSGARNISELLEIFVPGFQYMYNRWYGTLWGLRGIANDRNTKIIFLVNGHKMNTQARDGFQGETVLGLMNDIERVEVLRGPAGVIYGSGAIAGIVNLVTKSNSSSEVHTSVGTNGTREIDVSVNNNFTDKMKLSFTAGFKESQGLSGSGVRVYGNNLGLVQNKNDYRRGLPSDGRFGTTDGNWRIACDWKVLNFDLYLRATRQKESAGAWFVHDPWPDVDNLKIADSTEAPAGKLIEGNPVSIMDPFWKSTESRCENLRRYISDNLMVEGSYTFPIGKNSLELKGGIDRNTTCIDMERRSGNEAEELLSVSGPVSETFGETRVLFNTTFQVKSFKNLQFASGAEFRLDRIGEDMNGKNEKNGNPLYKVVTEVDYKTLSLFSEGFYDICEKFSIDLGGRLDIHTRALMANIKAAIVTRPTENNSIKLIYQTSSNNGSADNYEYNRNHFDPLTGEVRSGPGFERPYFSPEEHSAILPEVPELDKLHKLKPERVQSIELTTTHAFSNALTIMPSLSLGQVSNLFMWSEDLFMVINAGQYNYANADLDVQFESRFVRLGGSHTYQRPVFTDVNEQKLSILHYYYDKSKPWYDSFIDEDGKAVYYPITSDSLVSKDINLVRDGITVDGKNFLNLSTNVTKLYLTAYMSKRVAFHTNLRLFWGLAGRNYYYDKDGKAGYDYLHIQDGGIITFVKSVPKKLNASIHFDLGNDIELSLFAYDILGRNRSTINGEIDALAINAIRWQHMATPSQKDLTSSDLQTFGFSIKKGF